MQIVFQLALIAIGFTILIVSAEGLVRASSSLAKRWGVSDLAIGLTLVSAGTSAPELVVSALSAVQGYPEMAIGNILGSNIANILLILGAAGCFYPLSVQSTTVWREIPFSFFLVLLLLFFGINFIGSGSIERSEGILLFSLALGFIFYVFKTLKADPAKAEAVSIMPLGKTYSYLFGGIIGLFVGGKVSVDAAVQFAETLRVSEKLIGLTIVALGTSLPELVTSVVAAIRKNSDLAIGNVVGSNIFNIVFVGGITALIHPIPFNATFIQDIWVLLVASTLLFVFMFTRPIMKLTRFEASSFLLGYTAYISYLVYRG